MSMRRALFQVEITSNRLLHSHPAPRPWLFVTHKSPSRRQLATETQSFARQDSPMAPPGPPPRSPSTSSSVSSSAAPFSSSHSSPSTNSFPSSHYSPPKDTASGLTPSDWEENPDLSISAFSELPHKNFGVNQHIIINEEFKEALRQILWKFKAPIRYAFAYGSGVFPQMNTSNFNTSCHPSPPPAISKVQKGTEKMIDFIFGVSYSQHWHDINIHEHRDHYSVLGSLGSYMVSKVQDSWGAGVYFNPYITVNGTLIKYGVVNLDTLCRDLSEWDTLYLAGRLQKPVKILRDHPSVRLANQVNLISAVRTALLLLPPDFTEQQLYATIAGISYMGDPRMSLLAENPQKVSNIVTSNLHNFRRLYAPLIENLPNVSFNDPCCNDKDWFDNPETNAKLAQDMDPFRRGNMVRRLPKAFRSKLYFQYQAKFQIAQREFNKMMEESGDEIGNRLTRREGGKFEQRIAADEEGLKKEVTTVIKKTISWPSTVQSFKSGLTAGPARSWRYLREKRQKHRAGLNISSEVTSSGDVKKKSS